MLDKFKEMGSQIGAIATEAMGAVDEATVSVKDQAGKIATATEDATSTVTEEIIRKSVRRLQRVARIASDELQKNPPSRKPMQLVAAFQIGITYLELTVEVDGSEAGTTAGEPTAGQGLQPE